MHARRSGVRDAPDLAGRVVVETPGWRRQSAIGMWRFQREPGRRFGSFAVSLIAKRVLRGYPTSRHVSMEIAVKSVAVGPNGARLHFLEFEGTGTPLVMVHGLGCASSYEYPHVARSPGLAGRHVILLDLFGFGYSDHPTGFGYRVDDHAEALVGLVDALALDELDLYGHSMGGSIAITAADRLGSRVRNLAVSEANLDSGGGPFSRKIASFNLADYTGHAHAETIASALASGNHAWATTMRLSAAEAVYWGGQSLVEGAEPSWRELFHRHPARRSFIFGERSLPDPDFDVLPAHGVSALIVKDAGHSMGLENPVGLAAAIAEATSSAHT